MASKEERQVFGKESLLSLLAAVAISAASLYAFSRFYFLQSFGYLGVFLISLLSSATIFIPVPGFAIVFAMGAYLNPVLLGIAAGLGSGIGEISGYLVGYAGHNAVTGTKTFRSHRRQIEKYGAPAIFVLAFLPNPVFDLAGIASGAIKMPAWQFLLATIAGKTLRFILLAYAGGAAAGWLPWLS